MTESDVAILELLCAALTKQQLLSQKTLEKLAPERRKGQVGSEPFWSRNRIIFTLDAIDTMRRGTPDQSAVKNWFVPFVEYLVCEERTPHPHMSMRELQMMRKKVREFAALHTAVL